MFSILRIEGDPTAWYVDPPVTAGQLTAGSPVALPLASPLAGRLLLSPRAVGSVAVMDPGPGHGVIPSGAQLPEPCLYLPSPAGAGGQPRYPLPPLTDLAALESQIMAAMGAGSFVTVELTAVADTGVLVLNGAALSFAVLCPASPKG
ncbi:MAG TPA: hypothetical protein VIX86_18395 [Streptosporangiaceae bacterium]